jgi:hypothetical protein
LTKSTISGISIPMARPGADEAGGVQVNEPVGQISPSLPRVVYPPRTGTLDQTPSSVSLHTRLVKMNERAVGIDISRRELDACAVSNGQFKSKVFDNTDAG